MKKLLSLLVVFACSLLVFTGCGYEGGSEVKGIAFTSPVYYVDRNIPFELDYRVFPSTSSMDEVTVSFEAHDTQNLGKYLLDPRTGIITVTANSYLSFTEGNQSYGFYPMNVAVVCGSYQDTCTVIVKEYPSVVEFEQSNVSLVAGTAMELPIFGTFRSGIKELDSSVYDMKVTSSNPTVVSIQDPTRPMIVSTGKSGSAVVTCEFFYSNGDKITGLRCQANVKIVSNVADAIVNFDNVQFVRDFNKTLEISCSEGTNFDINPIFMDQNGFILSDPNYTIVSLNERIATIEGTPGSYKMVVRGEGTVCLLVSSTYYDLDGNPAIFRLNCKITFST